MTEEPIGPGPDVDRTTDDLERLAELDVDWQVELKADGRLLSPSPHVQEELQMRLRRAELMPTNVEWTVLRSRDVRPGEDGSGAPREVVCCGILGEGGISLIDFMGFLATGYQTGVLTLSTDEVHRSVYVHEGDVVWAASSSPDDRLGEFLLRRGKITREQLNTAMRRGGSRLGRACVECGFIAPHELWSMVQAQLTEIFDQILRTERGIWAFSRISSEALAESRIHLSTQGLLMDALRRLDEMKLYRQGVRSAQTLVQRTPRGEGEQTTDLLAGVRDVDASEAESLLRQLPRAATIQELMRYLGRGEFEVTRLVHHLLKAGLVELVNPEPAAVAPRRFEQVQLAKIRDVVEVYSMALQEMGRTLHEKGQDVNVVEIVRDFVAHAEEPHRAVLSAVHMSPDGRVDEAALLQAVTTAPDLRVEDINDALSELFFFVLDQATDLLRPRAGEELGRRVKVIMDLLYRDEG